MTKLSGSGGGIQQINELIGSDNAVKLCLVYGGVDYYIPHEPRPDHEFAKLIGTDPWEALCAFYGGTRLTLPRMHHLQTKKRQVLALLREGGLSCRQIARAANCTERYVRGLSAELKRQRTNELPLFSAGTENKPRAAQRPPAPRGADDRQPHQKESATMR